MAEFNSQLFMDMMKNSKEVIASVMNDVDQANRIAKGMYRFSQDVEGCSDKELRRKLKVTFEKLSVLAEANVRLGTIALVYAQSDNFTGDNAEALNKLGRGQEALREMFKAKMGG